MIRRILDHNILNGVVFSTVEFLLITFAAAFIAFGCGIHHKWLGAVLASASAANACVVVVFGAAVWHRGERGTKLRETFSSRHRMELSLKDPTMMKDILTLACMVLVPFVVLIGVSVDRSSR